MNKPINVRDLVYVAIGHSCALGRIHSVAKLTIEDGTGLRCWQCGELWYPPVGQALAVTTSGSHYELHRLKRIPPLEELEGEKHSEEIPA